jgi:D-hydroxyproline dehydrogenase subunit beta
VERVKKQSFDLVIVGGGIIGAMSAWRALRRQPSWRVLWVDRSLFGLGSSAHSAGLVTPYGRTPQHRALVSLSEGLVDEFRTDAVNCSTRELIGWYIASEHALGTVLGSFVCRPPDVASAQQVDQVCQSVPSLRLAKDEVMLGPVSLTQGVAIEMIRSIVRLCRETDGFSIWEGTELTNWSSSCGAVEMSFSPKEHIESDLLLLALGPWLGHTGLPADMASVKVKKVAACHIELRPAMEAPAVLFPERDAFLLPIPQERRWLFSFCSEQWGIEPSTFPLTISRDDDQIVESIIGQYIPDLNRFRHGGRIHCDGYGEDRIPVVRHVDAHRRVVFAGACAGSGYRLAPGIAETALNLLLEAPPSSGPN